MAKKASSKKTAKPAAKPVKAKAAKPSKPARAKPTAPKKPAKPAPKPAAKPVVKPSPKPAAKPKAKPAPAAKPAARPSSPKPAPVKSTPTPPPAAKSASTKPVPAKSAPPATAARVEAGKPVEKASFTARPGAVAVAVPASKAKVVAKAAPRKPLAPIVVSGDERVRPELPEGYRPSTDEAYMNANQVEYFRRKLLQWRVDLVEESKQTIDNLRDEVRDVGDEAERATRETENSLELRTRDRYRKLISKIDKALRRIEDGEYGYCEETGEEIGLERLEARPIATLCLDAQERWEHRQRQMGD
jgi:DnaK suppressor protein